MGEIAGLAVFLIGAGLADRDVDVGAQVAVLHVAVAGAEVEHDEPQLGDVGGGFLGAADVGAGDDLHQRDAGAVEVDEGHGGVHVVDGFARVLFQVDAFDADHARRAVAHLDQHFALAHDGVVELADLVALRQVGVEVVLAVEGGVQVDLCLQAQPRATGLFHAEFVDDGQHAGHARVDEGHVGIGLGPELRGGAGEELGARRDLCVHLHADDKFPVLLGAGHDLGFRGVVCQVEHGSGASIASQMHLGQRLRADKGPKAMGGGPRVSEDWLTNACQTRGGRGVRRGADTRTWGYVHEHATPRRGWPRPSAWPSGPCPGDRRGGALDVTASEMAQPVDARDALMRCRRPIPCRAPTTLRTATSAPELSLRPVARDPWAAPSLRWDGHPQDMDWTLAAMAALRGPGASLVQTVPRTSQLVPGLRGGGAGQRRAFWAGLVSALAWHESTHREEAVGGGGRWFGLVQISPATARYRGCPATSGQALLDGRRTCAAVCGSWANRAARRRGVPGDARCGGRLGPVPFVAQARGHAAMAGGAGLLPGGPEALRRPVMRPPRQARILRRGGPGCRGWSLRGSA
jgi:hypothetical protein